MELRSNGRLLGVLDENGRLLLSDDLRSAELDDPWLLWATALGRHTIGRTSMTGADLDDRARAAREELLPARPFADACNREPDLDELARILGLPVEVLRERLGDMDVALLVAQPLRGRDGD